MSTGVPSFFSEVRTWLEVSYFISQIVVMVLIGFGLRQIQLAKRQIETTKEIFRTQSRRAAVESAVNECRRFAEAIIHERVALDAFCREHSITYFKDVTLEVEEDSFSVDARNAKQEDVDRLRDATAIIHRFINGLESHALYFLSGVADEKIAFHVNAKAYLELAEHAFKLFPALGVDDNDLDPVKTLYFMWRKKYEAERLILEKASIDKKLSTFKTHHVKPIGT